jgi:hypothetical protein
MNATKEVIGKGMSNKIPDTFSSSIKENLAFLICNIPIMILKIICMTANAIAKGQIKKIVVTTIMFATKKIIMDTRARVFAVLK